jgi:UDP-GlcNAc:undecaprenyl-phosphate GlcNAc-1-phosphate transferase
LGAWAAFGVGALAIAALGLLDDLYRLGTSTKLVFQVALAALPVSFGLAIPSLPPLLSVVASMVWIVGITNAMNLLDNMDGLSAGVAVVAAAFLAVHAVRGDDLLLAGWAAALAGSCLGFLLFNIHPASIFMGDSGSLFLGYSLAVLSLLGLKARPAAGLAPLAAPLFVFLVPIFDTSLVTIVRLYAGRSPAQGGRDHTSHRLVSLGMSQRTAVLVLWLLAAAGGAVSLAIQPLSASVLALVTFLSVLVATCVGAYLGSLPVYQDAQASLSGAQSDLAGASEARTGAANGEDPK